MAKEYPLLIGHSDRGNKRLHNIDEVSDFICKHGVDGDVSITFEDGRFFLNTFGIYLNKIVDMEYRNELEKVLVPKQMSIFDSPDDDEEVETEESEEPEETEDLEMEM